MSGGKKELRAPQEKLINSFYPRPEKKGKGKRPTPRVMAGGKEKKRAKRKPRTNFFLKKKRKDKVQRKEEGKREGGRKMCPGKWAQRGVPPEDVPWGKEKEGPLPRPFPEECELCNNAGKEIGFFSYLGKTA